MTETHALVGPKILLEGTSGSGKTYAIGTAVDWAARQSPPREVFVLFTENGLETLLGYWRDKGKPIPENLHWYVVKSQTLSLKALTDAAQKVGMLSYDSITKMVDPDRGKNNSYHAILLAMSDFPDDRTGRKFGNIGDWGADKILCIDSLSELANSCMKMIVGSKPTASLPDYGIAQNNLMNLLRYFTQGFAPTLIMTAHVQRQVDEITGSVKLMTKAIGRAMADDIPQLFSETLYTLRDGNAWYWDTAAAGVDTKTRYLPIAGKIKPDVGVILDKWLERSKA